MNDYGEEAFNTNCEKKKCLFGTAALGRYLYADYNS